MEFEFHNAPGPGVAVGHGRQALVPWWRVQYAQPALGLRSYQRQRARHAAVYGLGRVGDAGFTSRIRRPDMAHRTLAGNAPQGALQEITEHAANILRHLHHEYTTPTHH
jgi:hypothetical protein